MSNITIAKDNVYNNTINQDVKLILANDIAINPGSVVIIKKDGKEVKYKNSGKAIAYSAHQELMLQIFDDTA